MSAILFAISFIVLMILVMKGVNLIPAAIIGGIILSFAVEGGPINALFTLFSQASGGFCSNLLIAFMFGGMFGSVMIGTGAVPSSTSSARTSPSSAWPSSWPSAALSASSPGSSWRPCLRSP